MKMLEYINLEYINPITVIVVLIFIFPLLIGALSAFTRQRVYSSMHALFSDIAFIAGLLFSVYLTKEIFFERSTPAYQQIYLWIPQEIKAFLNGRDMLAYLIVTPLLLVVIMSVFWLITTPIYEKAMAHLANQIIFIVSSLGSWFRRFVGALWNLPKAIIFVLLFSLLLNFSTYYFTDPLLSKTINESTAYQFIHKNALVPVLNSNIAKKIPVIVNDSFRKSIDAISPEDAQKFGIPSAEQLARQLAKNNIRISYFNGVTLGEAITSSPEIDSTAMAIVGSETNSKKKALLIYKWVVKNMQYDYDKAVKISTDTRGISSGSLVAFSTRKGICFDYSCLYISMCRAVGVKVRLVTGLGYSGVTWGDHAWNQVFAEEENRWVNVDTTFGTTANYFDKPSFNIDHQYANVQGEW